MFRTLKFIYNHPLNRKNRIRSIVKFFKWQFVSRIWPSRKTIYSITNNTRLFIIPGRKSSTANFYCGLQEFDEMAFLLHFIREGDLFVDIGANIGSYSVLAASERKAKVVAFEPIPSTFQELVNNIVLNNVQSIATLYNNGVAGKDGVLKFTSALDSENRVANNADKDILDIEVKTVDNALMKLSPTMLKIDVEGFEFEVLTGAVGTLKKETLRAIVIELNSSGLKYGFKDADINAYLRGFGFTAYNYDPLSRKLTERIDTSVGNFIYIRDVEFVRNLLKSAGFTTINGVTF